MTHGKRPNVELLTSSEIYDASGEHRGSIRSFSVEGDVRWSAHRPNGDMVDAAPPSFTAALAVLTGGDWTRWEPTPKPW
jgi:hypothetical protein